MIELHDVRKTFGRSVAVEQVSLRAADGQVTGLLGPNGAGKTTSLRLLTGLLKPDRGRVSVDGHDPVTRPQSARRRLGALPDGAGLYARLTAREHLLYAGELHGLRGSGLARSVAELIESMDLAGLADRRAGGYSAGERRKLGLACALVHGPQNVVLDEPGAGLDVLSVRVLRRHVRALAEQGRCVLFSSHAMQEVALLCDRIVVLAHGRVAAAGTPCELLERTASPDLESAFVKLIGSEQGLR